MCVQLKHEKPTFPGNNDGTIHQKRVLFLWLEGATFHCAVVGCKFNMVNI